MIVNGTAGNDALADTSADLFSTLNANWSGGEDAMIGGTGNDTYNVNSAGDQVFENAGQGIDTVVSRLASYTLGANVENLTLDNTPTQLVVLPGPIFSFVPSALNGTGNELDNVITGNDRDNVLSGLDGNDTLYGNGGNDTLDGGNGNDYLSGGVGNDTLLGGFGNDTLVGGTGDDSMSGGFGNDVYYVDAAGDSISEGVLLGGIDTVYSYVSETLDTNVENLTLINVAAALNGIGNASANVITGNSFNNLLSGLAGNDTLSGGDGNDTLLGGDGNDTLNGGNGNDVLNGNAGSDAMAGGFGNDIYYVDAAGDSVSEAALLGGTDTVYSYVSETLDANVENLTLINVAAALTGTGNASANVINGNTLNNSLYGLAGNDTLNGNDGNDYLGGGDGNDALNGGNGNDTLNGNAGSDAMNGGFGNDVYYIDALGDSVSELAFLGGVDTVYSYISDTLDANVENMTLLNVAAAANATGNASGNLINGNIFNNVLNGMAGNDTLDGGSGNDTLNGGTENDVLRGGFGLDFLTGGLGQDQFVFAQTGAANADTVLDFNHVDDSIVLSNLLDGSAVAGIAGLLFSGGNVAGNELAGAWLFKGIGTTGVGASDLSGIYVNTFDGQIWYNPTSAVANDSVLIGRVGVGVAGSLDASDFVYGA